MKVIHTEPALQDHDEILAFLSREYPALVLIVEQRIRATLARLTRFLRAAERSNQRQGVRVVQLTRYPYKIFYRTWKDAIEVLHIHHAARKPWDGASA